MKNKRRVDVMRRCPHCGCSIYDNESVFCPNCKRLIDKKLNLINDIDKLLYQYDKHENKIENVQREERKPEKIQIQNNNTITKVENRKEKSNTIYMILVLTIIIIAIFILMK